MKQHLQRLSAAINEIHASLSLRQVVQLALQWTSALADAEQCLLFLPQNQAHAFKAYFSSRQGKKTGLSSFLVPKTQGLEAWVLATGKSLLNNHLQDKSQMLKIAELPSAAAVKNILVVPLKGKNKTIGVLQARNRRQQKPFTAKQLHLLELLAAHIGTAVTNALAFSTQHAFLREQKQQLLSTTAQLRGANEKLRAADQAKSESISMVAHELRSPITTISGFARLLRQGRNGMLSKEQMEFCEIIERNSEHIHRLINDLLDLTKLELGKLEMNFEAVSCHDLIMEAVLSIQGGMPPEQQRISPRLPAPDLFIEGDRLRLVQVLKNLLTNAWQYSPAGSPIQVACGEQGEEVVFSVADQGDPLSSQQQQKVFEKFYRATSKPGAAPAGSGLGLAICRITVENHGGQLWVESGPEGGNAFRFRLKRVSGPAAPPL